MEYFLVHLIYLELIKTMSVNKINVFIWEKFQLIVVYFHEINKLSNLVHIHNAPVKGYICTKYVG
jgi:hypothetical protein